MIKGITLILAGAILLGCDGGKSGNPGKFDPNAYIEQKTSNWTPPETRDSVVLDRLNAIDQALQMLETRLIQIEHPANRPAIVEPESGGFAIAETRYGAVFIMIEKVERLETGHKFVAKICNPLSVVLGNIKYTVSYGQSTALEEREIMGEVYPGKWRSFEWVTSHKEPSELRIVKIGVNIGSIAAQN